MQNRELIVLQGTTLCDPQSGTVQASASSSIMKVEPVMLAVPYHEELNYLSLLQELVDLSGRGPPRADRTGTGTYSVFGRQVRFNLNAGFPLLTTKKVNFKAVVAELLWMLSGDTDNTTLNKQGVHIWDEWADKDGQLGPIYGKQWRNWTPGFDPERFKAYAQTVVDNPDGFTVEEPGIDQLALLINGLKNRPYDRGHIMSAWNVSDLAAMRLRPCHAMVQFYVDDRENLSCQLYQRSADIFLGVPFNIASYALLTRMVAKQIGRGVGEFIHTFGDLHLYANHVEQAKEQLTRTPYNLPDISLADDFDIFDPHPEDIGLDSYNYHPAIKGDVSV